MIKVIVGSHNPIKLETTEEAFAIMFPNTDISFQTFNSPSGVPEQPFGGEETKTGAKNRADGCKQKYPEADYWVGIEGGLEKIEESY